MASVYRFACYCDQVPLTHNNDIVQADRSQSDHARQRCLFNRWVTERLAAFTAPGVYFGTHSCAAQAGDDSLIAGVGGGTFGGSIGSSMSHPLNSFSSSLRCRSTRSTSKADTDGLPPYFFARENATRFNISHMSDGRLIPVVRLIRSASLDGAELAFLRVVI
jgi:hypothetical protein